MADSPTLRDQTPRPVWLSFADSSGFSKCSQHVAESDNWINRQHQQKGAGWPITGPKVENEIAMAGMHNCWASD
jgi:hypothetical protein